jgi:hypothetical protein
VFVHAFRNLCSSQPLPHPCPAGRLPDTAGPPLTQNRQHAFTHTPTVARVSPANPFLESPADSGTRAPNLQRLGQAGDARQDLVRISESTTKCGDYGEESAGGRSSIEDSLRIWKSVARVIPLSLSISADSYRLAAGAGADPRVDWWPSRQALANAVALSSRNHGDFPAILSEISRNSRYFCAG